MSRVRFYQVISILISLLLLHLPLPNFLLWFRPDWVLLNIIFWTTFSERSLPLWVVWALGVALDAFYGIPLGVHALGYLCVSFCGIFLKGRLALYSPMHTLTFVTILVAVNQLILSVCLATVSAQPMIFYWGTIPVTLLAWPIWTFQLQKIDQRQKK